MRLAVEADISDETTVAARRGTGGGTADGGTYSETTGGGAMSIYIYKDVQIYIVYTYYNRS